MTVVEGLPWLADDLARVESALREAVQTGRSVSSPTWHRTLSGQGKPAPTGPGAVRRVRRRRRRPASDDRRHRGGGGGSWSTWGRWYHDDVIDEASTRRGVDSVNHRWSNIVAILAGDFLLARASSLAATLGVEVAGILAATIGELCQGQVLDCSGLYDVSRDEAAYFGSIEGKTASLIATACRIGAIVGGLGAFGRRGPDRVRPPRWDDLSDRGRRPRPHRQPTRSWASRQGSIWQRGSTPSPVIFALRESDELRDLLGRPLDGDAVALGRRLTCANGSITAALQVALTHVDSAVAALADAKADHTVTDALTASAPRSWTGSARRSGLALTLAVTGSHRRGGPCGLVSATAAGLRGGRA